MSEHGKAQIQALGAGLLGFFSVVAVGSVLLMRRGDAGKAPAPAYAPVDVASGLPAPSASAKSERAAAAAAAPAAVASSPKPILSEADNEPAVETEAAAPVAAAAAPDASARRESPVPAKKLVATAHLDGSSSATSSARASAQASASAPAKAVHPAKKPFVAPKLDVSKTPSAVASVHYGVSNRAELMGRAAGPVYNFAGKDMAQKGAAPSGASGTLQTVDDAVEKVDGSSLSASDKATLDRDLGAVRQAVQAGPAAAK
jgi:hypothetical protein